MLFNTTEKRHAQDLPLNWHVEYKDGKTYSEYDEAGVKGDFYKIQQSKVERFGLFNFDHKWYYEQSTGVFILDGKRLEVLFESEDGARTLLTNYAKERSVITFKDAYVNITNETEGSAQGSIAAITFGYNATLENDIGVRILIKKDYLKNERTITVRVVPKEDMNGKIIIRSNKNVLFEGTADLRANYAGSVTTDI